MKTKSALKIIVKLTKDGKVVRKYLTPLRFTLFLNNKASSLLKNGSRIYLKVSYPDGDNEIKDCTMQDLAWARKAFIEEYL